MTDQRMLARRFEAQRPRLIAIAAQLLGGTADAEDVVQDAWLRLQRIEPDELDNIDAWLTTTVSRLSLDVLRSARRTRTRAWTVTDWPEDDADVDPGTEIAQIDRIGTALLTVLELLSPAERLALLLHDVFGLSFAEVAALTDRSPDAARQVASRARRRMREASPKVRRDFRLQRPVVSAWLAAVQRGDFEALLDLLDEGAVLHADYGTRTQILHGARQIAEGATIARGLAAHSVFVRVDGEPAVAAMAGDRVISLMVFTIEAGRILQLEVLADPTRLSR